MDGSLGLLELALCLGVEPFERLCVFERRSSALSASNLQPLDLGQILFELVALLAQVRRLLGAMLFISFLLLTSERLDLRASICAWYLSGRGSGVAEG